MFQTELVLTVSAQAVRSSVSTAVIATHSHPANRAVTLICKARSPTLQVWNAFDLAKHQLNVQLMHTHSISAIASHSRATSSSGIQEQFNISMLCKKQQELSLCFVSQTRSRHTKQPPPYREQTEDHKQVSLQCGELGKP